MEALRLTRAHKDSQNPHSPLENRIQLGGLSFIYLFFRLTFGKITSNGKYVNYFPEDCGTLLQKSCFMKHSNGLLNITVIIDEVNIRHWNEGVYQTHGVLCDSGQTSVTVRDSLLQ